MPLYCFNHLFGAKLMSFTDPRIYNFIFNKMLSLKWLWFYQTLPFDIFWYVCKHQQISVYIVHICMLFILLPCIYSRTLAHVATVTCWLCPTLNKFYLILKKNILKARSLRHGLCTPHPSPPQPPPPPPPPAKTKSNRGDPAQHYSRLIAGTEHI